MACIFCCVRCACMCGVRDPGVCRHDRVVLVSGRTRGFRLRSTPTCDPNAYRVARAPHAASGVFYLRGRVRASIDDNSPGTFFSV
jgi:hypothetical protein